MTFMQRILSLGAATLAAAAIASPALAQEDEAGKASEQPTEQQTEEQQSKACDETCQARLEERRLANEKRWQEEAELREAENRRLQAAIDREQAEADDLEEQTRLCRERPSHPSCKPATTSVAKPRPAQPKPVSYVAARQEKVSRHGNPAGVGIRPVAGVPDDAGLDDAVDVPDVQQFALEGAPAEQRGSRNLVWFSVVSMAAIASLGYGLWRVLFVEAR